MSKLSYYERNKKRLLEKSKQRYESNKPKILQKAKKRYSEKREEIIEKSKKYYYENKETVLDKVLEKKYNITRNQYNLLLRIQDFKCKICGTEHNDKKKLMIDHNHNTGRIRGLLCLKCNTGISHFEDNQQLLSYAIKYLQSDYQNRRSGKLFSQMIKYELKLLNKKTKVTRKEAIAMNEFTKLLTKEYLKNNHSKDVETHLCNDTLKRLENVKSN